MGGGFGLSAGIRDTGEMRQELPLALIILRQAQDD